MQNEYYFQSRKADELVLLDKIDAVVKKVEGRYFSQRILTPAGTLICYKIFSPGEYGENDPLRKEVWIEFDMDDSRVVTVKFKIALNNQKSLALFRSASTSMNHYIVASFDRFTEKTEEALKEKVQEYFTKGIPVINDLFHSKESSEPAKSAVA